MLTKKAQTKTFGLISNFFGNFLLKKPINLNLKSIKPYYYSYLIKSRLR